MSEENATICNIDDIRTIKQDTYYYCGAACIQMCINDDKSQKEIYEELHRITKEKELWYADPDSVYTYLNRHQEFERTSETSSDSKDATEKMLSSFIQKGISAPMLVSGGQHWVLYSGYQINSKGKLKGVYVRDPWPTTAPLIFYPFSNYFFEEYFCKINVEGTLKNRVESFIFPHIRKMIEIEIHKKPLNGGSTLNDVIAFKNDIIKEDLTGFGFMGVEFIKNGGAEFADCIIKDSNLKNKFLVSFIEIENKLCLVAVDILKNVVVGLEEISFDKVKMYNKNVVANRLNLLYNQNIEASEIEYIYDAGWCYSCFAPLILAKNMYFYLNLEKVSEKI